VPRNQLFEPRQGTAAAWTSANPVLGAQEMGLEVDTGRMKFGDGATAWTSLPYAGGSGSLPTETKTANYTVSSSDAGNLLEVNDASASAITLPKDATYGTTFTAGREDVVSIAQFGAGAVTVAGDGTSTINGATGGTVVLSGQYQTALCRRIGASAWAVTSSGSGAGAGLVNGVTEFGIDNTGTVADNSTAINNALAVVAAEGLSLWIPGQADGSPAIVLLQNPIEIGNGTSSTPSSIPGMALIGAGHSGASQVVASNAAGVADEFGTTILRWNGASGVTAMVVVNGPIQGVRLEHLTFDGVGSANVARAVLNYSGQFTGYTDLSFFNFACAIHEIGRAYTGTGVADCLFSKGRGVYIMLPNSPAFGPALSSTAGLVANQTSTASNFGMIHDGSASADTCFGDWQDIWIASVQNGDAGINYGVMLASCDDMRYRNVEPNPNPGSGAAYVSIGLWAGNSNNFPPKDIVIENVDFGTTTAAHAVSLVNGTLDAAAPVRVRQVSGNNGVTPNPNILGLIWAPTDGISELGYDQVTASVSTTSTAGTTAGMPTVTVNCLGTPISVELFCPQLTAEVGGAAAVLAIQMDGTTIQSGQIFQSNGAVNFLEVPASIRYRGTPSAGAHTFTGLLSSGTSGDTAYAQAASGQPMFIRVTQ
jgi:hypothetical protein